MVARLCSLLVWFVVAAAAAAWGWRLFGRAAPVPPQAVVAQAGVAAGGDWSRLLGQPPAAPVAAEVVVPAESRFKLVGVVAPRGGLQGTGLALISVDGRPARAVAVGRELEPGLRVLRVGHRRVELGGGANAATVALDLPPLAEPSRGRPGDVAAGAVPPPAPLAEQGAVPPGVARQQQMLLMQQQAAMARAQSQAQAHGPAPGVMQQPAVVPPAVVQDGTEPAQEPGHGVPAQIR